MRKWIFSTLCLLYLIALSSCALETEKEQVRVVYYSGIPKSESPYPALKIIVHAPYEATVKWESNQAPEYASYGSSNSQVTCQNGKKIGISPGTKSLRVKQLKPQDSYTMVLCSSKTDDPFSFEFKTPGRNIMTIAQWCNYPQKSNAMKLGFDILFKISKTTHCGQLHTIGSLQSIEVDDPQFSNKIIDLFPIVHFATRTKNLALHSIELVDIDILHKLQNLETFKLHQVSLPIDKEISDLTAIIQPTHLKQLRISQHPRALVITDELQKLRSLSHLHLSSYSVVSLSPDALQGIDLKSLSLENAIFSGFNQLTHLDNLEELKIVNSGVTNITGLDALPGIRAIDFSRNDLTAIDSMSRLNSLREINLSNNPISDFQPLIGLSHLVRLDLRNTNLASAHPLRPLESGSLEQFYFRGTKAFEAESCPFSKIEICRDFVNE